MRWLLLLALLWGAHADAGFLNPRGAGGSAPSNNGVSAAQATVNNNALCTRLTPFYWEFGTSTATLSSGTGGTHACTGGCQPVTSAATNVVFASASKWLYAAYVLQKRGSDAALTANDIKFLTFQSGYTNVGNSGFCANTTSINDCLALPNATLLSPQFVGIFFYDGGHMQNHAGQFEPEINSLLSTATIGAPLASYMQGINGLNLGTGMVLTQPLMAGGYYGRVSAYVKFLQGILNSSLAMGGSLGHHAVCTLQGPNASNSNGVLKYNTELFANQTIGQYTVTPTNAYCNDGCVVGGPGTTPGTVCGSTPINELWHYEIGHWVEDDPVTHGDGAWSSPGSYGVYPSIDGSKTYYFILARYSPPGSNGIAQQGYASAECGRLVRRALMTGIEQTGTIPTP